MARKYKSHTIDLTIQKYKYLKMMSHLLEVSIREFVLAAVVQRIEKLAEKGKAKTIPWKKREKKQ